MKPRNMTDVARAVDGLRVGAEAEISSIATDSREVVPGCLFVALPGDRVDGHRFVTEAFERGAAGVMVRDGFRAEGSAVWVRSTNEALLRLAADERGRTDATVVGITGANGKTSTKDMAAEVCRTRLRTHASPASFNNEIGLPVTLLSAPPDAQVIVAEMGARHPGDVRLLCDVARPSIVVVTNVGVAHLEIFGSWEAIVAAAAEPVEWTGDDGVAILSTDDPVVAAMAERCRGKVVTFGTGTGADVRGEEVHLDRDGAASFLLAHEGEREPVTLCVPGEHMVGDALAAAAIGLQLGIPTAVCAEGLGRATVSDWRMETFTSPDGVRVVNDAYNANPESMEAALRTARWMAGDARLIAVLGTMAELGPIAVAAHERLGELAARLRVNRLITVGAQAELIAIAGMREGVEPDNVASYGDPEDALADVRAHAAPGDVVLFKGSRVTGLERIAERLR